MQKVVKRKGSKILPCGDHGEEHQTSGSSEGGGAVRGPLFQGDLPSIRHCAKGLPSSPCLTLLVTPTR